MALSAAEEAQIRLLLDQQAAILSLAGNEATITSKLGATKVNLSDLTAASALGDTDLFLVRQGTTDKSATGLVVKTGLAGNAVQKTSDTGSAVMPAGTTAERDATPEFGWTRANETTGKMEWYNGTSWASMGGGATGGGADEIFFKNGQTVNNDHTIAATENAGSFGPISIASGKTVTITTGGVWTIV